MVFSRFGEHIAKWPGERPHNLLPWPVAGLTVHFPEPGPTQSIIVFKNVCQLAQQIKKASTCSSQLHFFKIPSEIEKCHMFIDH